MDEQERKSFLSGMAPVLCLDDLLKQLVSYLVGNTLKSVVRVPSPLTFPYAIIIIILYHFYRRPSVSWSRSGFDCTVAAFISTCPCQCGQHSGPGVTQTTSEWTYNNLMHIINATF